MMFLWVRSKVPKRSLNLRGAITLLWFVLEKQGETYQDFCIDVLFPIICNRGLVGMILCVYRVHVCTQTMVYIGECVIF